MGGVPDVGRWWWGRGRDGERPAERRLEGGVRAGLGELGGVCVPAWAFLSFLVLILVGLRRDMKDRMGVRGHVHTSLDWRDPDTDRLSVGTRLSGLSQAQTKKSSDATTTSGAEPDEASICRALRGFVAWKV